MQACNPELGKVILCCRNRRRVDRWLLAGGSMLAALAAPFMIGLGIMLALAAVSMQFGVPAPIIAHPIWGPIVLGSALCGVVLAFAYFFRAPRTPCLVLHDHGISYQGRPMLFVDLMEMQTGRAISPARQMALGINRQLGKIRSANAQAALMSDRFEGASLTAVFKNGDSLPMPGLLFDVDDADLQRFLEHLAWHQPALLRSLLISSGSFDSSTA